MIKLILIVIIICILLFINIKEPYSNKGSELYILSHNYANRYGLPLDVVYNMFRKMYDKQNYTYRKKYNYL